MTKNPLWNILKTLPSDFKPYGNRDRDMDWGPDCSCQCKHFQPLQGKMGSDWGVCTNPHSPRAAQLTWEHQGCWQWEGEERDE